MKVMKSSKIMKMSEFNGDQKVGSKWPPQYIDVGTLNAQKGCQKEGPKMSTCLTKVPFLLADPRIKSEHKIGKNPKSDGFCQKVGSTFEGPFISEDS